MTAVRTQLDCLPLHNVENDILLYMNFRSFVFDDFRWIRNAPQSNAKRKLCIYTHTTSGLGLWLLRTLIMAISQRKHKKAESNSNKRSSVVVVVAVFMLDSGQKAHTHTHARIFVFRARGRVCVYGKRTVATALLASKSIYRFSGDEFRFIYRLSIEHRKPVRKYSSDRRHTIHLHI